MFLSEQRLIFVHIPKTAGNAISKVLLPFADDKLVVSGHQDGYDRFSVVGPHTLAKHQSVAGYEEALGGQISGDLRVLAVFRNPIDRLVSLYFSPHRFKSRRRYWSRIQRQKLEKVSSPLNLPEFRELIQREASSRELLVNKQNRFPDNLSLLPFEDLEQNLFSHPWLAFIGSQARKLPRVNRSANDSLKAEAVRDPRVIDAVMTSRHVHDLGLAKFVVGR